MNEIKSIMVVIESLPGKEQIQRAVENAFKFGGWLKCELHFVCDPGTESFVSQLLKGRRLVHPDEPSSFVVHTTGTNRTGRILETIEKYSCDMILLQTRRVQQETAEVSQIVQTTSIPVLVLNTDYDFDVCPPKSLLVPLSGEQRESEALQFSLNFASQTECPVDLVHVATSGPPSPQEAALEDLGDEPYHEYRDSIDKIASEASPYSTAIERTHIRQFYHLRGFTADQILKVIRKSPGTILVLEWKGSLALGHAHTVRKILETLCCPVLFTKIRTELKSTLKVGKDLDAWR